MFKIILTNDVEDIELFFKIRNTPIAQKWFNQLKNNYEIFEDNRFASWHKENLVDELNKNIETICQYDPIIDSRLGRKLNQKKLNYMHKYFEDLRGEVETGTEWYNNAPKKVKKALNDVNILIHKLESELNDRNQPTLTVTFKDRPRIPLSKNDLKYFTFKWTKGTVYIDYCHVGKPVLDVFKDKDPYCAAVRPQTHYSADFVVKFGRGIPILLYYLRQLVIKHWLKKQNWNFENVNLGLIPVADITKQVSFSTLKKYNKVKAVKCVV